MSGWCLVNAGGMLDVWPNHAVCTARLAENQILASGSHASMRAAYRLMTAGLPVLDLAYWKARALAAEAKLHG